MTRIYQIKMVDPEINNFSLKYRIWEFNGVESEMEMEKQNSLFLKKDGYKFNKFAGELEIDSPSIVMLLNDFFNVFKFQKKLIKEENVK